MFFNCLANINKKNKTQILKFYKLRKLPKYEIRFILKKIKIFKHFNYLPLAKINEVYIYKRQGAEQELELDLENEAFYDARIINIIYDKKSRLCNDIHS